MKQYYLRQNTQNAPNALYKKATDFIRSLDRYVINEDELDNLYKVICTMAKVLCEEHPRCKPIKGYKSMYNGYGWIGFVPEQGGIVCEACLGFEEIKGYYGSKN